LIGEALHVLAGGFDLRHQVFALDDQGLIARATKSDMKDSTIFSEIDLFAAKHSISEFFDFGLFEKLAKEFESFWGNAVFRVINEKIIPAVGQGGGAIWILGEEISHGRHRSSVVSQFFPRGEINRGAHLENMN
jgi:hypothetical protein